PQDREHPARPSSRYIVHQPGQELERATRVRGDLRRGSCHRRGCGAAAPTPGPHLYGTGRRLSSRATSRSAGIRGSRYAPASRLRRPLEIQLAVNSTARALGGSLILDPQRRTADEFIHILPPKQIICPMNLSPPSRT